jgi:hypothetical protein
MFHAAANGSLIAKPLWGLVSELTLDDNGMRRLHEEKELVLGDQGKKAARPFIYSSIYQVVLTFFGSQEAFATAVRPSLFTTKLSHAHDTNTLTGILRLEEAAKAARRKIIKNNLQAVPRSPLDHIFTEDEKNELITREIVQGYKAEGIREKLVESAGLERALFDVVYPLFGSRQKGVVNGRGEAEGSEGDSSCLVQ